ncbi:MAG: hypothetical protein ACR5KV_04915 [Wolbachia sp.]
MYLESQSVDAEEMKRELLDKIKDVMSSKQKFLNLFIKKDYVAD